MPRKAKTSGKQKLKTHKATAKRFRMTGTGMVVRTKRGKFASSFTPAFVDDYRYYVVAKADDDNDRGRSDPVELRTRVASGGGAPAAR